MNGTLQAIRPAILTLVLLTIGNRLSVGQSAPGVTDKMIVIGSCSALEGPWHALGTQQIKGAQAYFELINEEGGIAGRKLKLVAYDDSYDPAKTETCFKRRKARMFLHWDFLWARRRQ